MRKRAEELGQYSDRVTSCRVILEAAHRHHRHGKRFRVSIDMTVSRRHEIVIGRSPSENQFLEDAHAAVDRAFDEAERGRIQADKQWRRLSMSTDFDAKS